MSARLAAAAVLLACFASPAHAQDRFDAQLLRPAPAQRSNGVGVWSAEVLPDSAFEIGLLGHYDSQPLVLRGAGEERLYRIVDSQLTMHLLGGVGLFDLLEISGAVPIVLSQSGDDIPTIPNFDVAAPDPGAGPGDARLIAKLQLVTTHTEDSPGGAAFAILLEGSFPTGDPDAYRGDEGFRFSPKLVLDGVSVPGHRFSFNLGYTFRPETEIAGLTVAGTVDWGFAARFESQYVHVIPEVRGSLVPTAEDFGPEESPIEAGLTIRVLPIEQLQIQVGGGVGLFQGFGAPDYRVLFGASWLQAPPSDRDGDGYPNDEDGCPDEPEDFDEFEDADGCPDPDNDQDGILDPDDRCPLEPEDRDEFEDSDGCPDPDNDQDGILDEPDQCPNEPEDRDEFQDADGCPDPDNDQDGILDEPDQCPNEPEDQNGVEDQDGCPEVDTDGDGLLDPVDRCPREPEDRDGFEDEDGCPDPDNDQDGILDEPDQCPNEPEVINGFEDEDGCPDESRVRVTCRAIEITEMVYFETNRAVIQRRSHGLLDQIGAVLSARPDIRLIRVEGHTDSRARDEYNMDLSNQRAASVREYLVTAGIAGERLQSQGFGETRPVESNATSTGRAANRRVEFVIVEQEGCREGEATPAAPAATPAATPAR